ncbi:hypothetical protein [Streptodolium elevatio]|uniref:Secreted protein n=1 Tax=Streptodolium elevatio TaxID=3157996 RepID=A0ABV3DWX7_9ACTN
MSTAVRSGLAALLVVEFAAHLVQFRDLLNQRLEDSVLGLVPAVARAAAVVAEVDAVDEVRQMLDRRQREAQRGDGVDVDRGDRSVCERVPVR